MIYFPLFADSQSGTGTTKTKANILKISTKDEGVQIYGQVYKYSKNTRAWKKVVVILKDFVLYELGGLDDTVAKLSTVILGYKLEPDFKVNAMNFHNFICFPYHPALTNSM